MDAVTNEKKRAKDATKKNTHTHTNRNIRKTFARRCGSDKYRDCTRPAVDKMVPIINF